jgi:hypothetical protein
VWLPREVSVSDTHAWPDYSEAAPGVNDVLKQACAGTGRVCFAEYTVHIRIDDPRILHYHEYRGTPDEAARGLDHDPSPASQMGMLGVSHQ